MSDSTAGATSGARFFDKDSRDLGWARTVTKLDRAVSTLTVFDVSGAEPQLALSLARLDRSRLRIECMDVEGTSYRFKWASGYGNGVGQDVRIQGVLEPRAR